jgi:hypothetical protein
MKWLFSVRLDHSVPYQNGNGEHGEMLTDRESRISIYLLTSTPFLIKK